MTVVLAVTVVCLVVLLGKALLAGLADLGGGR